MSDSIETAKFLRRYQSWRKGEVDSFYPDSHAGPNPVEISAAIDRAIAALEAQPPCGAGGVAPRSLAGYLGQPGDIPGSTLLDLMVPAEVEAFKHGWSAAVANTPIEFVLAEYERQTDALPAQHEIPERGCCTYNWQKAVIRDLRKIAVAQTARNLAELHSQPAARSIPDNDELMNRCDTLEAGWALCQYIGRLASQPAAPIDVADVCNAYESGMGHRGRKTADVNPYPVGTPQHEAYRIGAHNEKIAAPVVTKCRRCGWLAASQPAAPFAYVAINDGKIVAADKDAELIFYAIAGGLKCDNNIYPVTLCEPVKP